MQDKEAQKQILDEYERVVKKCDLSRQMQEILSTYLLFEKYFKMHIYNIFTLIMLTY